ncbi:MAG: PAS domain S-box protein [Syntrophaceae bacterium]
MRSSTEHHTSTLSCGNILETLPVMICGFLSPEGVITLANRACCECLGKNPPDIIGRGFLEFIPVEEHERIREHLASLSRETTCTFEHRLSTSRGERRLRTTVQAIGDHTGNTIECQSVSEDITDRVHLEEQIRLSEEKTQVLLNATHETVIIVDRDFRILAINESGAQRQKKSVQELIGTSARDLHHWLPLLSEKIIEAFRTGTPATIDVDCDCVITHVRIFPILGSDSTVDQVVICSRKTSRLVMTEPSFDESLQQIRQLADLLPEAMLAIDLEGRVVMWNQAMEGLTRVMAGDMLGKSDHEYALPFYKIRRPFLIDMVLDPDREIDMSYYSSVSREGDTLLAEAISLPWWNRSLSCRARPIYDSWGRIVGAIESLRDITEQKRTEEALRASEERFRMMAEVSPDIFWIATPDLSRNIYLSPAFEKIFGIPREQLYCDAKAWPRIIHPEDREKTLALFEKALGQDRELEYRIMRPDGTIRWVRDRVSSIRDDQGAVMAITGMVEDITERRQAEEALRLSEQCYRLLAENVRDVIWVVDKDLRFNYVSPSIERMHGFTVEEALRADYRDFVTPRSLSLILAKIREENLELLLSEQGHDPSWSRTLELEVIRKDKTLITAEITVSVLPDEKGAPSGLIGVTRDITERRRAEDALRESEERFRKMAEVSSDLFWMVTPDWSRTIYASAAFEKIFGISCEEVYRDPLAWLTLVHPEDLAREKNFLKSFSGQDHDHEYRIVRPDGTVRWIQNRGSSIRDAEGNVLFLTGMAEDITERKQAGEERRTYEMRLMRAQKMEAIGTLAGGIAHDFNNILSAIIGYSELAQEDLDHDSHAHTCIEEILKAGERATDLVRQILTFSRQVETERRPVKVHLIAKEVLKLLRSSIPSTIALREHIDRTSGAVFADATQIHQVIMNLCTNAYQAMLGKAGEITLSLESVRLDSRSASQCLHLHEGPYLKLSVRDTGCGMDHETMRRIFDPFFTTKEKGKGTGLGLATVHGIVHDLGGAVLVESRPGEGSSFDVYLPRCTDEAGDSPPKGGQPAAGNGECILLVDDEEAIVHFTRAMLEQLGYTVCSMTSSIDALMTFKADPERFNLVITDQTMPSLTGMQLASSILVMRPDMPIILTTGFSETLTPEAALSQGICQFVEKPFTKSTLAAAIRRALLHEKILHGKPNCEMTYL